MEVPSNDATCSMAGCDSVIRAPLARRRRNRDVQSRQPAMTESSASPPPTPLDRFAGARALVTGAASGIGAATALRLAAEGATVACLDLDGAGAELTATA